MKFALGVEPITAINDGGLGIRWNDGSSQIDWQPGGIRPVLSLEVLSTSIYLIVGQATALK